MKNRSQEKVHYIEFIHYFCIHYIEVGLKLKALHKYYEIFYSMLKLLSTFLPDGGIAGEDGGRGLAKSDSEVSMASATRLSVSEACLELEDIRPERRVGVEGFDMFKTY